MSASGTFSTRPSGWRSIPKVKNDVLGMYAVATGSDGYQVAFSLGELNPAFGNQSDIIANSSSGAPLSSSGFARIVVPNDVKAGRYVPNLVSLEVFHVAAPVPEPATRALMIVGACGLMLAARRSNGSRSASPGVARRATFKAT